MDMETIAHQAFHAVLAAVILFTIIPARVTADSAPQGVEAAASQQETSGAACDLPPSGESLEGAAEAQKNASIPMLDLQGKGPLKTATFALGWFWGPDSRFGSLKGVVRTRVGYAGGSKNDPTYYDLGDHMEAIQIDYDPDILTYRDLLQVFLSSHDPSWPSPVRQYASAVFAHDEEQERLARAALGEIAGSSGKPPATLVLAYTGFNRAEDYHQKYYLRSATAIASLYQGLYPDTESFTDSTAVARVNGYIGGNGTVEQLETELPLLGLGDDLGRALLDYVAMWGK